MGVINIKDINYLCSKVRKFYEKVVDILNKDKHIQKYYTKKKEIYKKYDIKDENKFCIFEVISNKYFRETFHSDVIAMILNPKTREIGDIAFFNKFLNFLGTYEIATDVEVIKEEYTGYIHGKKGYIDIACYYTTDSNPKRNNYDKAIIIENKINYAPDMDNQLVRYVEFVKEEHGIENPIVVYLTLRRDKEAPNPSTYDASFENAKNTLQKNFIHIAAITPKENDNSLVDGFLMNCLPPVYTSNVQKSESVISFFINQYIILLNHLGGDAYMENLNKNLIESIYSEKKLYETIEDLVKLWTEREINTRKIIKEKIEEKIKVEVELKDYKTYREFKWGEDNNNVISWPTRNNNIFLFFFEGCNFGFVSDIDIQESEIDILLNNEKMKFKSAKKHIIKEFEKNWVYWDIDYKPQTVVEDTIDNLIILHEKCKKNEC